MASDDISNRFTPEDAAALAATLDVRTPWPGAASASTHYSYFVDPDRFVLVAGGLNGSDVDRALAYGFKYAEGKRLHLMLPRGMAFPTLQRAAWLKTEVQPVVHVHSGSRVEQSKIPSPLDTIDEVTKQFWPLDTELRNATAPPHFGPRNNDVSNLINWASSHPQLDAAHRKGERAWQCAGQKVLSVRGARGGLQISAGIQFTKEDVPERHELRAGEVLDGSRLRRIQEEVEGGIASRLRGDFHKNDEHWLQSVIRRNPALVGVEQPALRELPAWRPKADVDPKKRWGRGFIDLLGVDGFGDVRIVETKIATNKDEMLVLQGLDYYIWARAYREHILGPIGAPKKAELVVHYVIGATDPGEKLVSIYTRPLAEALTIPYRFQVVRDWFNAHSSETPQPSSELLPQGSTQWDKLGIDHP